MKEPTRLNVSSGLRSWLDRIWRYMRASRILPGRGYRLKRTADGTILDIAPGGTGGTPAALPHILVCYNGEQVYFDEIEV